MHKIVLLFIYFLVCTALFAQSELKEGERMEAEGNYSGAEIMYRLCMEQNDTCLLKLIRLLYDEKIEPQFEDELFLLAHPLAENGEPETQYYIGMMYLQGKSGAPQDDDKASLWLQKSATQGYEPAKIQLATLIPEEDTASETQKILDPPKTKSKTLTIPQWVKDKSTTFYALGGVSIAAGIAATLLLPKDYTEYEGTKRIEGKQYSLVYTVVGVVAGGVCIGLAINHKKKASEKPLNMSYDNIHSRSPSIRDNPSRLDLVATGNLVGLRLTF